MHYFAVRRVPGPHWNPALAMREQPLWEEHALFMNALAAEGFVVLGGPLRAGNETLLLVRAEEPQQILDRLALDPWEPTGILQVIAVDPWNILLGELAEPHHG